MNHLIYLILLLVSRMFLPCYNARLQLLIAQIRMLRARLDSGRIVPTPEEKAELLHLGARMQDDINNLIAIVKPETNASGANLRRLGLRCDCSMSALTYTNQHFFKAG